MDVRTQIINTVRESVGQFTEALEEFVLSYGRQGYNPGLYAVWLAALVGAGTSALPLGKNLSTMCIQFMVSRPFGLTTSLFSVVIAETVTHLIPIPRTDSGIPLSNEIIQENAGVRSDTCKIATGIALSALLMTGIATTAQNIFQTGPDKSLDILMGLYPLWSFHVSTSVVWLSGYPKTANFMGLTTLALTFITAASWKEYL